MSNARSRSVRILGVVLFWVIAAGRVGAEDVSMPVDKSNDSLAYAAGLRASLGFDNSVSLLQQAASDPLAFPVRTLGAPMSVAEGAEVDRRIRVQLSLGEALDAASQDPGFAGAWIDQLSGGVPVFAFTHPSTDVANRIAAKLPVQMPFEVATARASLDDLRAVRDQIVIEVDELAKLGIEVTGVGTDIPGNRNTLTVANLTIERESILAARYGNEIVVREEGYANADACPASGCLPLKGGIGIVGKTSAWNCTTGYLAKRTDVSPDTLVIVTAGHCVQFGSGTTGNPWHHGTTNIGYGINSPVSGKIETYFNNSSADVGLISIFSTQIPATKNMILVDESPVTTLPVETVQPSYPVNYQIVGSIVCRMGVHTGRQCGTITDNDQTKVSVVPTTPPTTANIQHTVVYGRDADGGDSGGPIFIAVNDPEGHYAALYGTHVHSDTGYVPTGGSAWYSPVDRGISQIQTTHAPVQLHACISASCP